MQLGQTLKWYKIQQNQIKSFLKTMVTQDTTGNNMWHVCTHLNAFDVFLFSNSGNLDVKIIDAKNSDKLILILPLYCQIPMTF